MKGFDPITDAEFERKVLEADGIVAVYFWADWCGPCRMVKPALEKVAPEFEGRVKFFVLDTDLNKKAASRLSIEAIPYFVIFKGGIKRGSLVGVRPEHEYRTFIGNFVGAEQPACSR